MTGRIEDPDSLGKDSPSEVVPNERDRRANQIGSLFLDFGAILTQEGLVRETQVYSRDDVFAYFRLKKEPDRVVNLQGFTQFSSDEEIDLFPTLMDYEIMKELRMKSPALLEIGGINNPAIIKLPSYTPKVKYDIPSLNEAVKNLYPSAALAVERLRQLGLSE